MSEADVADLSRQLQDLLMEDQRKARAPRGMAKCPLCGAIIEPTKTKRIRVHESSPYTHERCPASGRAWKEFGKRAPRPRNGQDLTNEG